MLEYIKICPECNEIIYPKGVQPGANRFRLMRGLPCFRCPKCGKWIYYFKLKEDQK